jgi:predicted metallopeptidase
MHNLPFIVGDLFVAYDKHWLNFLLLHKLFNLTFAYVYDERTVKELKVTIELYLENFIQLHKNERITPKMHYLTHFPSQLENYGPLRHHSCFRFESRIGLLKRFRFNNFINLAYSVSDMK